MINKKNIKREYKGRKALSPVVSTIILIMIVIIIAIIIILWYQLFFKEIILKTVGGTSKRAEDFCKELELTAISNPDGSFGVSNEGNVPIWGFVIRTSTSDGSSNTRNLQIATNPGYSVTITKVDASGNIVPEIRSDYTKIKLIPILLGKKKNADLTQTVTCPEIYAVDI